MYDTILNISAQSMQNGLVKLSVQAYRKKIRNNIFRLFVFDLLVLNAGLLEF